MDPRLHDAELEGIRIIRSRGKDNDPDILLSFRSAEGHSFEGVLHSARYFRCDNFRQGNIVLEMAEVLPSELTDQAIEHLRDVGPGHSVDETRRISKSVKAGACKFIRLEASYGADFWAVCRGVEFMSAVR